MKWIDKQEAPESFVRCVKKHSPSTWELFTKNHPEVKQQLADQLLREQGNLCCYCEQHIYGGNSHIEHLQPKGQYPKRTFDYENLLSSCLDKDSCGTKKGHWFSDDMVTPLDEKCEERFHYLGNGTIIAADPADSHAQETIHRLNLNCEKLKDKRMKTYKKYRERKKYDPDFTEKVSEILRPNSNGEYAEFWTTIKYVAEKV